MGGALARVEGERGREGGGRSEGGRGGARRVGGSEKGAAGGRGG